MTSEPETLTATMTPRPVSRRRLTIGMCVTVLAIAFEAIAVATALPVAARDLDGLPYYAWAFSLFVIGMLFATVVAGRLCDRIGPARPLIAGMVVFAAGLVVAGTAEYMGQLVAGRLVQGLGSGIMNTAIWVLIAQAYDVRDRPRMITYISTAWVVPSFVGPPVSAWLTRTFSWHWVFIAVLPFVAFAVVMVLPSLIALMRVHAEPEGDAPPPAPLWAAGLVAVAAAAIQLAGQRLDWIALILLVGGIAGLGFGLPRLMPPGFLRLRRGLSAVILVRGLLPGAYFGGEAFIPLMLVEQRHLDLLLAGAVLTAGAVGWTTGSFLQARPWFKVRRDVLIRLGCLFVCLGLVVVALVAIFPTWWYGMVGVGWIFAGLGMGFGTSSSSLAVMRLSESAVQGRNGSSLNLFDALGSGVFVGLSGTIFATLHPGGNLHLTYGVLLGVTAVVALLAAAASLRIGALPSEFASSAKAD